MKGPNYSHKVNLAILIAIKFAVQSMSAEHTSSPQIVHVVSILEVPSRLASTSFQSNDVKGAQKSEFLF